VVITDLDGKIEYVNAKFEEVTGYTLEEVLGKNPRILKSHTTEGADFYRDLWGTIISGHEWHGEFYNRRKDGTFYWEEAAIAPIFNAQGDMTHFIAIKEDITARKAAEEAQRDYAEKLEARNAELDAFSHTVAHDLKNPLAAMIGFSSILQTKQEQISQEKRQNLLHQIEQTGFRMQSIIDELLLLASVREVSEVGVRPLDMGVIVRQALRRIEFLTEEHEAEFILPERWPKALGYAAWVEEVWVNYLSNAVKYGGRPPRVELGATMVKRDRVRYWVRDNGEGLSAEEQARLFTPFERLHQVNVDGHGLGLSIVRRIMEKLNGTVGVESNLGQGSEFYFTLPTVETTRLSSSSGSEMKDLTTDHTNFILQGADDYEMSSRGKTSSDT
jgi:PAS domain S-box-containing protein